MQGDETLFVRPGVEQPEEIKSTGVRRRRRLGLSEYVEGILRGDRIVLARAITLIESSRGEDAELAQQIIDACLPRAGDSIRVGITGVPGAGKSTFIEALGNYLIGKGNRVAVLAVDPSSERSGGSILGDKTRMERLANSEMAFIRPSPAGGSLGGVARRTRETMILCEAAGFRTVLIETVGVGQSETLVHGMVDFFLLLMIAGAGDELQGIKRGIVEMADLLAINKADGDNVRAAERCQSANLPKLCTCFRRAKTVGRPRPLPARQRPATASPMSGMSCCIIARRCRPAAGSSRTAGSSGKPGCAKRVRNQLLEQFRHDEHVKAASAGDRTTRARRRALTSARRKRPDRKIQRQIDALIPRERHREEVRRFCERRDDLCISPVISAQGRNRQIHRPSRASSRTQLRVTAWSHRSWNTPALHCGRQHAGITIVSGFWRPHD